MLNRTFKIYYILLLVLSPFASAHAANLTVTSFADVINGSDGVCTLREAIIATNTNTASGTTSGECSAGQATQRDFIVLPAGTYTLTAANTTPEDAASTGDLDITGSVTLTGEDASTTLIDASSLSTRERVLHILNASAAVTLNNLTLKGGYASDGLGGGIYLYLGRLSLSSCSIIQNTAEGSSADVTAGGGIYVNSGRLDIIGGQISNNTATSSTASLAAGGGIFVHPFGDSSLSVRGVTVSDNLAINTNVSGSVAGAGIFYDNGSSYSVGNTTFNLERSTLARNQLVLSGTGSSSVMRYAFGGGLFLATTTSTSYHVTLTLSNSTISGNEISNASTLAATLYGAGIYSNIADSDSTLSIQNSTVANNTATDGSGLGSPLGGGLASASGASASPSLRNTIIANNSASQGPDCSGVISSYGYNLLGNTSDCSFTNTAEDITDTPAQLSSLGNHGGPTETHALLADSPALGTGSCTTMAGDTLPTDQRYIAKSNPCDIGAYEANCGDGDLAGDEECDDANSTDGDGCNSICEIEIEVTCTTEVCGDGIDQDCDGIDAACTSVETIDDSATDDNTPTTTTESDTNTTGNNGASDTGSTSAAASGASSGCSLNAGTSAAHTLVSTWALIPLIFFLAQKTHRKH